MRLAPVPPTSLAVALAIAVAMAAVAPAAIAQCPWAGPPGYVMAPTPLAFNLWTRGLTASPTCTLVMNSAQQCLPGGTAVVSMDQYLRIGFNTMTTTDYCEWSCGGEICRINAVDGLPVELLDFTVDSEEDAEPEVDHSDEGRH